MSILKAGLVAFGLVIGTAAMGQVKEGKSPQERAQFRTDRMATELSLTEEQKTKVAGLNLQAIERNQAIRANASLNEEQKKEAWRENHKAQKAQLKEILTAEQLAVLKAKQEERQAKHKERIAKHGEHKSSRTPQERAQFKTEWMTKELSLTAGQQSKVAELNLASAEKNSSIRKDKSLTPDQRKAALKASREEQKASMKEILTAEQMKVLKVKKDAFKGKHHKGTKPGKK